jgi:hypothetical protein
MPNFFDRKVTNFTNASLAEIEGSSERGSSLYGASCLFPETKRPRIPALEQIPSLLGIKGEYPLLLPLV